MARRISVEIVGDSRSLERAFSRSQKAGQRFSIGIGTIAKSALVFEGVRRGLDVLGRGVSAATDEFRENAVVAAQTRAALRSTGAVAGVSARGVARLGASVQRVSGISDELVRRGANLILTFRRVRNEAGKGNKIFDRATKAAVNLSVAGFGSIETTAKQLGKALQDPVRGMTALRRAGVTFTKAQEATIKRLVETGRLLEAQKFLLREVEIQVGGSARAFGQTLPGQLARLREAVIENLGGLVGAVTPAFTGVLREVNRFVDDLTRARTVRAKLEVVFDTITGGAEAITQRIGDAVRDVDWDAVWEQARGIGDGLQERLDQIDFGFVGKRIGDGIATAVRVAIPAAKELGERVSNAVATIDFEALGKKLGPGLATAVVTAFTTLLDPAFWIRNWDLSIAVAATVFRARIVALGARLLAPVGRLGGSIVLGIVAGIERAAPRLASSVLSALLVIPRLAARALSPITGTVSRIFGRLGRLARFTVTVLGIQAAVNAAVRFAERVKGVFEGLGRELKRAGLRIALAFLEPFSHLPRRFGQWARDAKEAVLREMQEMSAGAAREAQRIADHHDRIARTQAQLRARQAGSAATSGPGSRNQAQAARESRTPSPSRTVSGSAVTATQKTVTSAADKAREAFEGMVARLRLTLERSELAGNLQRQAAALEQIVRAYRDRIRAARGDVELQRELVQILGEQRSLQQAIAEARRDAQRSRQFRALGLTDSGEERIPGVAALRRELSRLDDVVKGTFLDTSKTRSLMQSIRRLLSGQLGALGRDVRSRIQQILADLNQQLDQEGRRGPATAFVKRGLKLTGLDLTPEQIKEIRQRHAASSAVPDGRRRGLPRQPGFAPPPALAGFGAAAGALVVHTHVHLDGREIAASTTRHQQKARGRRAGGRRGTRAGLGGR